MSQDFHPRKSIYSTERRELGIKSRRQILQGHLAPRKNTGKMVHRNESCKSVNLKGAIRVRQNSRKEHKKPCNKKYAPAEEHGIWQKVSTSPKNEGEATFYSPTEALVMPAPTSKIRGRFQSVNAHVEQKGKGFKFKGSGHPFEMASGEVQTNEEAQVYVHDLEPFVTVQILEDTTAVLSLGTLCEEHGYSYEWASGQRPHLTKNGITILCKMEYFVPVVVPGLSSRSSASSSSTSFPQDSSSTFSSPASLRSDEQASGNRRDRQ